MPDVIMLLQLDHHKTAKVLDLIQQQVTNMARRAPLNYHLLERTFDYLSGYPDQCHHPKEDLVYRKLLSRFPDMAEPLEDLVGQHEKLADLTRGLTRAIGESRNGPPTVNEGLADQLRTFVDFYRLHMLMEERHFFPLALQRLSRKDFAEIDFTLFDQPDRLFNRGAEETFAALHDAITQLGIVDNASTDHHEQAAWLGTYQDIAAFNLAMQRAGEPVNLTRCSGGGYDLERGGEHRRPHPCVQ